MRIFKGFVSRQGADTTIVYGEKFHSVGSWYVGFLSYDSKGRPVLTKPPVEVIGFLKRLNNCEIPDKGIVFPIEDTVSAFIGKCDYDGKPIFENDILSVGFDMRYSDKISIALENSIGLKLVCDEDHPVCGIPMAVEYNCFAARFEMTSADGLFRAPVCFDEKGINYIRSSSNVFEYRKERKI